MRQILLPALLLLAACQQQAPQSTATKEVPPPSVAAPASTVAPTKLTMPEGFELPFAYNRLNENAVITEDGKAQHRSLVEFLDVDAASVESSLTTALQAKGFSAPSVQDADDEHVLTFDRDDGATVVAKINSNTKGEKKTPNAMGTVHITWTSR